MCTNEKSSQTFSQHLLVPVRHVVTSFEVVTISVLHISYKPEVQACDDFKTLMYTSKGEQINFRAKVFTF